MSSYIGSAVKAKVSLIEQAEMGGDCLNSGCVPGTKLIRTANLIKDIHNAEKLGLKRNVNECTAEIMEQGFLAMVLSLSTRQRKGQPPLCAVSKGKSGQRRKLKVAVSLL